jgi:HPt (histidine-containing phosphotransfer) domain-containing protein
MDVDPREEKFAAAMTKLWLRFRGAIFERVDRLESAALAHKEGTLNAGQRQRAVFDAHKLVGSLGTFGFPEGGEAARQLERLLESETVLDAAGPDRALELVAALRKELARDPAGQAGSASAG